jgi:hypothetical protein
MDLGITVNLYNDIPFELAIWNDLILLQSYYRPDVLVWRIRMPLDFAISNRFSAPRKQVLSVLTGLF